MLFASARGFVLGRTSSLTGTQRKSELNRAPITRFGVMSRKTCWQSRLFASESKHGKKDFKLFAIKFFHSTKRLVHLILALKINRDKNMCIFSYSMYKQASKNAPKQS